METAATWLRWTRAGTVATVATLMAVWAHVRADGHAPSLPVLLFLALGLTGAAASLLVRPASASRVVLLTVGGQLVAHYVITAASVHDTTGSAFADMQAANMPGMAGERTGHHAGLMLEHGASGAGPASESLLSQLTSPDTRMMAAHVLAAVVVGLWLAAAERAVWSLLTHIWRALRLPALVLPSTPVADSAPAQQQTGVTLARLGSGSVVRRGPPHLLAT